MEENVRVYLEESQPQLIKWINNNTTHLIGVRIH